MYQYNKTNSTEECEELFEIGPVSKSDKKIQGSVDEK